MAVARSYFVCRTRNTCVKMSRKSPAVRTIKKATDCSMSDAVKEVVTPPSRASVGVSAGHQSPRSPVSRAYELTTTEEEEEEEEFIKLQIKLVLPKIQPKQAIASCGTLPE